VGQFLQSWNPPRLTGLCLEQKEHTCATSFILVFYCQFSMGLAIFGQSVRINAQAAATASLPPTPHAKQIHVKHVLVIGQTKGFEHDSISTAMAAIYNMGKESGLWDTTLRTDTELLTTKRTWKRTQRISTYFDLLVFASTTGELEMDASQRRT